MRRVAVSRSARAERRVARGSGRGKGARAFERARSRASAVAVPANAPRARPRRRRSRASRRFKDREGRTFSRATPKTAAGTRVGLRSSPRRARREPANDTSRRSRVGAWARTFGWGKARGGVIAFGAKASGSLDWCGKYQKREADLSSRGDAIWWDVFARLETRADTPFFGDSTDWKLRRSTKIFFFRDSTFFFLARPFFSHTYDDVRLRLAKAPRDSSESLFPMLFLKRSG